MTATHTHVLRLAAGAVRLEITEAPAAVYLSIKGVKLRTGDIPKFLTWASPIIDAYRDDPRPFEMAGEHVNWTGRVENIGGLWFGRAERREVRQ